MYFRLTSGFSLIGLLVDILALYEMMIVIRAVLSWVADPYSRVMSFLTRATEPVIMPVRSTMNRLIGTFRLDFSPAVTVALIELLRRAVITLFR